VSTPAEATEFERLPGRFGPGRTVEYKSMGQTLAYIDYDEDKKTAAVTVFTPSNGYSREYGRRPADKAEGIVLRHLAKEGYTPGEPRQVE
jgi:hypothetical protein